MSRFLTALVVLSSVVATPAVARKWTDKSGNYSVEADLIAFDDNTNLILQKSDKTLLAVKLDQLSAADQAYVRSKEAAAALDKLGGQQQKWTMKNGLEVLGKVVDYARREVTVRMFRGKIYVNDKDFNNLPEVYKKIVPRIVAEFTSKDITDEEGLRDWLKRIKGGPETFTCEGVLMEMPSGDLYAVPFFLFSDQAVQVLMPGWERWLASEHDKARRQESALQVQTQARLYQQQQDTTNQMLKLQLQLQAYNAGLFSLWEVVLYPNRGTNGSPLCVVVPGENSRQAGAAALAKNPGYSLGPIRRVHRR